MYVTLHNFKVNFSKFKILKFQNFKNSKFKRIIKYFLYIFFLIYKNVGLTLSKKQNRKKKESIRKRLVKGMKIFLKKIKTKNVNIPVKKEEKEK